MNRQPEGCSSCGQVHRRVRATQVQAVIHHGHLVGEETARDRKLQPVAYEAIEFCGNPTCERVFRAEKQQEAAA